MSDEAKTGNGSPGPARPYWFPDAPWEDLPEGVRAAIDGVIGPGYQDLVIGAADAMERLAGLSVVHLAHLEILDQIELAALPATAEPEDRWRMPESHLRLVAAKTRTMSFLQRLREARGRSGQTGSTPSA